MKGEILNKLNGLNPRVSVDLFVSSSQAPEHGDFKAITMQSDVC